MYMFGLEGSGFIISLALILLVSGAVMFYCLRRFSILENSIIDQGKILQSFIIKMQQQTSEPHLQSFGLANDIAISSALEQIKDHDQNLLNSEKIEVSDNEHDDHEDSEDSEESDDEDDATSTTTNDNKEMQFISTKQNGEVHTVELYDIKLDTDKTDNSNVLQPNDVKIIAIEELSNNMTINDINLNIDPSESNDDSNSSISNDCAIALTNTIILSDIEQSNEISKKPPLSKMRVGPLRTLVCETGLIANLEMANKLKKEDLVKLLNK